MTTFPSATTNHRGVRASLAVAALAAGALVASTGVAATASAMTGSPKPSPTLQQAPGTCLSVLCPTVTSISWNHPKADDIRVSVIFPASLTSAYVRVVCSDGLNVSKTVKPSAALYETLSYGTPGSTATTSCTMTQSIPSGYSTIYYEGTAWGFPGWNYFVNS